MCVCVCVCIFVQDSMEQSVIEEEMPLDVAMQQSRVVHTAQRVRYIRSQ